MTLAIDSSATDIDRCWARIGVHGDRSCAELPRLTHCRNCGVYATAARRRLDGDPLPASAATIASIARPLERARTDTMALLVFRVTGAWFALPAAACVAVTAARPIHSLPHRRSPAVLGVANIRGELRICVSLAALLDLPPEPAGQPLAAKDVATRRLLVVDTGSGVVVLPVDEIDAIRRCSPEDVRTLPGSVASSQSRLSSGTITHGDHTLAIIDLPRLDASVARSLA